MYRLALALAIGLGLLLRAAGEPQTIPAGAVVRGDVATIQQDLIVDGEVTGSATSWLGSIVVRGHVRGDVVSYTGNIVVEGAGQVDGHALALGGKIERAGAIAGQQIEGGPGGRALRGLVGVFAPLPDAAPGLANLGRVLLSVSLSLLLLALSLGPLAVWPVRTGAAAVALRRAPGRSAAAGLLATVAAASLLPLAFGLLAATVIGIPVAVLLVLIANLPYVAGLAVLVQTARAGIERDHPPALSAAAICIAAALLLPLTLVGLVAPAAALALFYVATAPGVGALLLSRGGTLAQ